MRHFPALVCLKVAFLEPHECEDARHVSGRLTGLDMAEAGALQGGSCSQFRLPFV